MARLLTNEEFKRNVDLIRYNVADINRIFAGIYIDNTGNSSKILANRDGDIELPPFYTIN